MNFLLIAAFLSLMFFSIALAVELHRGEGARARELLVFVGLSLAVAAFATHQVVLRHWTVLATACTVQDHCL